MKKALLILTAALMCLCACKNQGGGSSDKGGSDAKVSANFNVDGEFYIKYLLDDKDTWIIAVKDKMMRMDIISPDTDYDESGNEKTIYDHHCYLVNQDGQFMFENDEWKEDDYTPRGTIFNSLSALKINPQKYYDAGFVKTGTVNVLGHELDVYSGDGRMQNKWAGYEFAVIGHTGDYKESFATFGGILFYLTEDDAVACKAVSAGTKVPDAAFQKSLDVDWAK